MNTMKQAKEASEFDLFTGGPRRKTADFVIYYNMAISNIEKMISHYEKRQGNKKIELKDLAEQDFHLLQDTTYLLFADYLWRANAPIEVKNKNDYGLKPGDKEMIHALFTKLINIRNYQSHIWHDNAVLAFDNKLRDFVMERYDKALAIAFEQHAAEVTEFEKKKNKFPLFKKHGEKHFITDEGKIFFLSFFLTTGQMSRFLQQRKGSKRTDQPLFKIKHIVYKHYCHRDGSSLLGFHHEENILNEMEPAQKKDVLKARQAYKIISYLYDFPSYLGDNETIPLIVPDEEEPGKIKKVNTIQELLQFIKANKLLPNLIFAPIIHLNNNSQEEFELNRSVAFTHTAIEGYVFHIGFDNLYKLTMLCLKYEDEETEARLIESMKKQAAHRSRLYEILNKNEAELSKEDHDYLTDKSHQYLRGYRILTEKGIVLFEDYIKKRKLSKKAADIAERIRPTYEEGEKDTEPIIIHAHDFIEKTEQKFRTGNRFVYFATKYLIDHKLCPGWYWEAEKFIPNKIKEFQKEINTDDDWRLSIENEHVTVAIPKEDNYSAATISRAKKDEPQAMYQFSLGPRALRYLLAFHILNKDNNLNDFLAVAMKKDFDTLHADPKDAKQSFLLLEEQFLPQYLKEGNGDNADITRQIERITNRCNHIKQKWDEAIKNRFFLKRAEKNRIVMECYRLFDWNADDRDVKFLRKKEYTQLSVCHYTLKDKGKFNHLFNDFFKLNNRRPPIPQEVVAILKCAGGLDDLMTGVINDRRKFLDDKTKLIADLKSITRKRELIALSRKIGLSIPAGLSNEQGQRELMQKRQKTLAVQPFLVHPIMLLKYFNHASYKADYKNAKGVSKQGNDIFRQLRSGRYTASLFNSHYDTSFITKIIPATENEEVKAVCERQAHKWTGSINTTQTEDALLWQIALRYLDNNPYTASMAEALMKKGNTKQVGNIHSAEIKLELKKGKGEQNADDTMQQSIYVLIKMHQLDDIMFAADHEKLRRAALHYIERHSNKAEKAYWDTRPPYAQADRETKPLYDYKPDSGTTQNPIPYQVLRDEMQRIAQHGIYLAGYILDWERHILNECTKGKDASQKQLFLKEKASQPGNAFIDFKKVIELSEGLPVATHLNINKQEKDMKKELTDYRGRTFHSGIPVKGSYTWWARPDSNTGKMLGVTEPLHWHKDDSMYKNDAKKQRIC